MITIAHPEHSSDELKNINARVMVLVLSHPLMLTDIFVKFLEDTLNRFQVTEPT